MTPNKVNISQRPNYFAGQYLLEDDFQLEQQYHIDRQRSHNSLLHVAGIAKGLNVSVGAELTVTVSSGIAIDPQGQQIIVLNEEQQPQQVDLKKINGDVSPEDGDYILSIGYSEQLANPQENEERTNRRWKEIPQFKLSSLDEPVPQDFIPLAKLSIEANNSRLPNDWKSVRLYSGLRLLGSDGSTELTLCSNGGSTSNIAILKGSLSISDKMGIGTDDPKSRLEVKGTTKDSSAAALNVTNSESSSLFYISNDGNVGIGTTNPVNKLEVNGNFKLQNGVAVNNISNDVTLAGNSDLTIPTEKAIKAYADTKALLAGSSTQDFTVRTLTINGGMTVATANSVRFNLGTNQKLSLGGNGSFEIDAPNVVGGRFVVTTAGNVGIGTNNPSAPLQVQATNAIEPDRNGLYIFNPTNSANQHAILSLRVAGAQGGNPLLSWDVPNESGWSMGIDNSDGNKLKIASTWDSLTTNTRMTLDANGNVGIGINNPTVNLDVKGISRVGSHLIVLGNVGIGTQNADKGKVQIEGSINYTQPGGYRYLNRSTLSETRPEGSNVPYSLYASHFIGATEFNAFSDMRIKEIKGVSDSTSDLKTLLGINITDYTYKDKVANDNKPHKKVIGQQIAKVFPQAVKTHTDVVPDIFRPASIADRWVNLPGHGLQAGERVKILVEDREPEIYTIEAITPDRFQISLNSQGEVFVYGREVNDFHVVDYDALAMLHISATQELWKIIDALKTEVQQIKAQLNGSAHSPAVFSNA